MTAKRKQGLDTLYASPLEELVDFRFDERVVDVFPDMIQRSVPGYGAIISMISVFAKQYAQDNSHCYDLGCSLGAATLALRKGITQTQCDIIAVDNAKAMIERGQSILTSDTSTIPVTMLHADLQDVDIKNASVVVMNFTLQFIPLEQRLALISRIYQGLNSGGVLILSEKIAFDNLQENDFQIKSHHDFKRANGYSDLEISQKRSALEKVLIPETVNAHQRRLSCAGFESSSIWFQCFNFMSLIAVKS